MAKCPFCESPISQDLSIFGGNCPTCMNYIPGEEEATDPGEAVKAEIAAQDEADARRRSLAPVFFGAPIVAVLLFIVVGKAMQQPETVDALELDFLGEDWMSGLPEGDVVEEEPEAKAKTATRSARRSSTSGSKSSKSSSEPTRKRLSADEMMAEDDDNGRTSRSTSMARDRSAGPRSMEPGKVREMKAAEGGGLSGMDEGLSGMGMSGPRETPLLKDDIDITKAVKKMVRDRLPQLRSCFEKQLKRDESFGGVWRLSFVVGKNGQIGKASADGQQMSSDDFETCLEGRMNTWRIFGRLEREKPLSFPVPFKAQ